MTRAVVALVAVLMGPAAALASDVPYLSGRVVDNADILSAAARARLTGVLAAHEQATSNQIVVLTVPTIEPESIEQYAADVFKTWKLGQKGQNNGILVVVVPNDRKMRIEVGYGLEPVLPDISAGAIIRDVMTPAFKRADYDQGIESGVAAIVARLEGKAVAAPVARPAVRNHRGFERPYLEWPVRILLSFFVFSILGLFTVVGMMTPGTGWFMYVFLIPFWSMFPMMLIGPIPTLVLVAVYLIGYPLAKLRLAHTAWYRKAAIDLKTKGTTNLGGFVTVSGGGGGGSFSSGGGGFSGGGGSSGGGGASGSW
jgi:uncharacterized protein